MIPLRAYLALGLAVAVGLMVWHYNSLVDERDKYRESSQRYEQDLKDAEKEEKRVEPIIEKFQEVKQEIVYVDKIVTKKVIEYRHTTPDRCVLDGKWVRIHDEAISGVPEDKSVEGTDGKTAQPKDSADALEVIVGNSAMYKICQARLHTLQDLVAPYVK